METEWVRDYLRFFHSEHLSLYGFASLLAIFGHIQPLLTLSAPQLRDAGLSAPAADAVLAARRDDAVNERVGEDLRWCQSPGHSLVTFESPDYPEHLRQIVTAPPLLFVKGHLSALTSPQLAVVGSRRASVRGRQTARWLARELAGAGLVICSGLAAGIDAAAHEGALLAGHRSVAVLGTGIDDVYPKQNTELARQLLDKGALVSEFPRGSNPVASNFPRRNRIISGLSRGTLVVEATLRSGSLVTARYALEQNRDVFAVPGSLGSQGSAGCHFLIKQGARLVETPADVLQELDIDFGRGDSAGPSGAHGAHGVKGDERLVLSALDDGCTLLDDLMEHTGLDFGALSKAILKLELEDRVESLSGRYSRKPTSLA